MGHALRTVQGAVLFIDILGFGALTSETLKIEDDHISVWLSEPTHAKTHQFLAANILVEFRAILQQLKLDFPSVKISQLSDCFFAWSENLQEVVSLAHKYMYLSITRGLLSRGGLAHGEIIETQQNHDLGRLILGKAVTTAVGLEKHAKGARLLIDIDFPEALYTKHSAFADKLLGFFEPFENPLDFQTYDEFLWYLADDLKKLPMDGISHIDKSDRVQFTINRLKLVNHLLHDKKLGWNESSNQGKVHLQATINFLSVNGLDNIVHDFDRRLLSSNRSATRLASTHELVEDRAEYHVETSHAKAKYKPAISISKKP